MGNRRGKYGLDAPWALARLVLGALLLLALMLVSFASDVVMAGVVFLAGACYTFASAASHLHTTLRGRFAVWKEELARLDGHENVLDLGCGRGAVLLLAAGRLTSGHATGVHAARARGRIRGRARGRSRSDEAVTRANAEAEGVRDRVHQVTADLRDLPFGDEEFDVVLSALALRDLSGAAAREQAVREAYRVVRPGGLLLLADLQHTPAYEAALRGLGARDVRARDLGRRYWYGGPWLRTCMVEARKP
ncbi:class I SAM-dependent methyltransferase [Nonomuraea sp. MCN248]|uniref:Class I SAM-dependent methyltransferase n=1 Tax=Nonomuraea corallina TaxID=2989783 RepID=A0ABT4SMJ1_9ACTN|nr:class I SAM-dependent methyltransferase [Nonomuraea corallina]MDA0638447.1 class I SAM-dependent methyltransferase [Nonomuraea corallina]